MAQSRLLYTATGALAALLFYVWWQVALTGLLSERAMLVGLTATGVFFAAILAIGQRIGLPRAALYAAAQAVVIAGLLLATSLRFAAADGMIVAVYPLFCALVLTALPLPFFIAHAKGDWRDYAALFEEAWQIFARYMVGIFVVGAVWALLGLSELLLSLVGLDFMEQLFDWEFPPFLITGAAIGFGMAVAGETLAPQGAGLALMLLRPMLPLILAVVALFLLALPFRGLSNLFGDLSAGGILLAITAVSATLISAVVDARGESAVRGRALPGAARVMAVLMALLASLAAWAIFLRVQQYGWTPQRSLAALAALVGLGYGAAYVAAVVRADWMARIRSANIYLALVIMAVAALLMSPLLPVERIATASQMARLDDGRTAVENLDILAFETWGKAGRAALDDLAERAKQPGQEALAQRLANPYGESASAAGGQSMLRAEVITLMPLQPATARDTQAALLGPMPDDMLADIRAACMRKTGDLTQSCAMIVADFLPNLPGDEGLIALIDEGGAMRFYGLRQDADQGNWAQVTVLGPMGYVEGPEAVNLLRSWQVAPPSLTPAPMMQIPWPNGGVILQP